MWKLSHCCFKCLQVHTPPLDGAHVSETRPTGGTLKNYSWVKQQTQSVQFNEPSNIIIHSQQHWLCSLRYNTINYFKISLLRVDIKTL